MGVFGVAVSPFELDEWQAATGITPDLCSIFESWSRQRAFADVCAKVRGHGHTSLAVTWEPWDPVPVGATPEEQGAPQPDWDHASILRGDHDDYIDACARSLRDSGLIVYLRFAHEFNGSPPWYPWGHDPEGYVKAWRYVRNRMRTERGAWNVRMVWAPNPDLWRPVPADWLARLLPYWPGPKAIDVLGATMINFGSGVRLYPVPAFTERFDLARRVFGRPVWAMETNVARDLAAEWLDDLAGHARTGAIPAVILSQGSSRAAALGGTGDLSWTLVDDVDARAAVCRLVAALRGA